MNVADAPVVAIPLPGLLPLAMRMALELEHPIYDCLYLAAAVQKDTHVVTADQRFFTRAAAPTHAVGAREAARPLRKIAGPPADLHSAPCAGRIRLSISHLTARGQE